MKRDVSALHKAIVSSVVVLLMAEQLNDLGLLSLSRGCDYQNADDAFRCSRLLCRSIRPHSITECNLGSDKYGEVFVFENSRGFWWQTIRARRE